MKRWIVACVALLGAALLTASFAVADKPDKPDKADKPEQAKNLAAKQCAALKKADRKAFRATYGPKKAMRACKKAETDESAAELKNAAKECKAEKAADPVAFEEAYGDDDPYSTSANAFGKCVSTKVKAEDAEDATAFGNAAKECKAERAEDPDAFEEAYGSKKSKGKNALGKCVSQHVRAEEEAV